MNSSESRIIIIAGTYGVGKTSLAHVLSNNLNIKQHVGVGIISRTLSYIDKTNPTITDWGNYNSCSSRAQVIEKLHAEARIACGVVTSIVEKAKITGASYIIDGVQLLPEYLPMADIDYLALTLSDKEEHMRRFHHPTSTKFRHLDRVSFHNVRIIDEEIVTSARKQGLLVLDSNRSEDVLSPIVIAQLRKP